MSCLLLPMPSGDPGDPKGVMITHAALVSAIAGCNQYLDSFNETLGENDAYLSFLPLAHVFDRYVCGCGCGCCLA